MQRPMLKPRRLLLTAACLATTLLTACGASSSGPAGADPATDANTPAPTPTPAPGANTDGGTTTTKKTPDTTDVTSIFGTVTTAAASTKTAMTSGLALGDGPVDGDGDTAHCTAQGDPISNDNAKNTSAPHDGSTAHFMADTDPGFAAGSGYCMLTHDSAAPDSLSGSLGQANLFVCMIGKSLVFDGASHDIDLTSPAVLACFTGQTPADNGVTKATVTASNPPAFGGDGWDFSTEFHITIQGQDFPMKLLWKASEGKQGFASLMPPVGHPDPSGKAFDAFAVVVDKTNGRVIMDSKFQRLYSQGFARTIRLAASGTLGADNKFTALTDYSFLRGELFAGSGDSAPADPLAIDSGRIITGSGTVAHGILTEAYNCMAAACRTKDIAGYTAQAGVHGTVFGGDASGAGATAILVDTSDKLSFQLEPEYAGYVAPQDWFGKLKVPTWTVPTLTAVQD